MMNIDEWEEMTGIYEEEEFKENAEDLGLSNYFTFE